MSRRRLGSGLAYMRKWSPALAERWCTARINRIENLLMEMASAWGDVDDLVVRECDRIRDDLSELRERIKEARDHEEGREAA